MTAHTPGPWTVLIDGKSAWIMARDSLIAEAVDETGELRANAPLIAAAPDLLAALETMTAWVEKWQRDGKLGAGALLAMANHVDEARAALTKVRV